MYICMYMHVYTWEEGIIKGVWERVKVTHLICNDKFPNHFKIVKYWLQCSDSGIYIYTLYTVERRLK